MTETARVELYNLVRRGRAVGNGFLVRRVLADGRGAGTLRKFDGDETAARAFAERFNADPTFAESAKRDAWIREMSQGG